MHKIINVKPLEKYQLEVGFDDGIKGRIDLSDLIGKGVFTAIKELSQFNKVNIDLQTHTVCWPGGLDLCPDAIYEELVSARN